MAKASNLAAFSRKVKESKSAHAAATAAPRRERGAGDIVSITMRLTKEDWKRLHVLGMDEGKPLQALFVEGLSMLLKAKGLPPVESPVSNGKGA